VKRKVSLLSRSTPPQTALGAGQGRRPLFSWSVRSGRAGSEVKSMRVVVPTPGCGQAADSQEKTARSRASPEGYLLEKSSPLPAVELLGSEHIFASFISDGGSPILNTARAVTDSAAKS